MVTFFYHAGVHCYTLLATKRFLVEKHLLLENCPEQSPDLNVIEALWWEMNNKKAPTKKKNEISKCFGVIAKWNAKNS